MEGTPEEALKQPAGSEPPRLPPEPLAKPARPGILKSPPSLCQPQKESSTKTLRFKMDQPVQLQPTAPLALPTATLQAPSSEAAFQHAMPDPGKSAENKDVRGKVEMLSTASESTQESLSESSSSSSSSSPFQSSVSLGSPDWLSPPKKKRAAPVSASVVIVPTTPMTRGLGSRKISLPSWFPDGVARLFGDTNDGTPRRQTQGRRGTEQDDESSPSTVFEGTLPWRSSLSLQALMGFLGGLALVFVISLMVRESRKNGSGNIERRQLEEAVTIGPEDTDDDKKSLSVPQITLSDIEEPPQASAGTDKATACTGGDMGCLALRIPAEATGLSATSATSTKSTVGVKLQEAFGKMRKMRTGILRASRKVKRGHSCGPSVFTYCRATRPEFYYDSASGDCVATQKLLKLCSRGPNRFPSEDSCHLKCVQSHRPDKRCFHPASAVQCSRQDRVDSPRWYFDGKRCRRWLPRPDLCPSHGGLLFTTPQECKGNCTAANADVCRALSSTSCEAQRLGFYFAHRTRQTFRCLSMASMTTGRKGRACLMGANRFSTMQACRKVCVPTGRTLSSQRRGKHRTLLARGEGLLPGTFL